MSITVFDPRQSPQGSALAMAPPLATLEGAVVGMIDNAKIGTERLFDFIEEILRREHGVREFIRRRKPDASRPVPPAMLAQMAGADAILAATGD
ncbi:MAG: hypothetical protein JNM79_12655 [Burkholderiales bacterium]|nr:hypothetical protein [Burkholderiales bacterium]